MMCAIAGILGYPVEESTIKKMMKTMTRRGPDENGVFRQGDTVLIHCRLAVIDPAGGHQPMELDWQGKQYVLCYNGELYNTAEIRKDLQQRGHHFSGHSDKDKSPPRLT